MFVEVIFWLLFSFSFDAKRLRSMEREFQNKKIIIFLLNYNNMLHWRCDTFDAIPFVNRGRRAETERVKRIPFKESLFVAGCSWSCASVLLFTDTWQERLLRSKFNKNSKHLLLFAITMYDYDVQSIKFPKRKLETLCLDYRVIHYMWLLIDRANDCFKL